MPEEIENQVPELPAHHKLARMLVAAAIAGMMDKLVTNLYTVIYLRHHGHSVEITEVSES